MTARVVVTGAAGFVGGALVARLRAEGVPVRSIVREGGRGAAPGVDAMAVASIDGDTNWDGYLEGADVVVHCAARAHLTSDRAADPLAQHRRTNRDGSVRLADASARAGARRFVFISTIGVHGAETFGTPFRADDAPAPHSPYAVSKWEAEERLRELSTRTGLELTIIRPPLVYGPGAPGNFATLLKAVDAAWPLPLGSVHNVRSLVGLDNLVDLIVKALRSPRAAGQTLLAGDGVDVSTTELLRHLAAALGRPSRLFPFPALGLRALARAVGRPEMARSLVGSLQVDIGTTCRILEWTPPFRLDHGLVDAAQHFRAARERAGR